MTMYDNISLVLQGPVSDKNRIDFRHAIDDYKKVFPEIIVSTYTEHLDREFIDFCNIHNIVLVHQTVNYDPKYKIEYVNRDYNLPLHTLSTLFGLKASTKKYSLKHRTDERYTNIYKVIDKLFQDNEKQVTGSSYLCSKLEGFFFESPDHIMAAKTEKLIRAFDLTLERLSQGKFEKNNDGDPAPEITFTKNFIRSHGEDPDMNIHDDQMIKYFDFINDREMFPFVIRCNSGNMMLTQISQIDPSLEGMYDMRQAINRIPVQW